MEKVNNKVSDIEETYDERPTRLKKLGAMAIDFFLLFIVTFLFFGAIATPIYSNLPSANENYSSYQEKGKELVKIADSTHLQMASDENYTSSLSMEETGKKYLTSLLKTSCYINGIDYEELDSNGQKVTVTISEEDTFLNKDFTSDKHNDLLSYYFVHFKYENNIGDYMYNGIDYSQENGEENIDKKIEYLNSVILKLDSTNKDLVPEDFKISSDVFYLTDDNTNLLMQYLNFNDTNTSSYNLYVRIQNLFQESANIGIKDVESNYDLYKTTFNDFKTCYNNYVIGYDTSIILCYLLASIFIYLFFPLCFKDGVTLGYKIMGMKTERTNGSRFTFPFLLIRFLIQTILFVCMTFFIPVFLGKMTFLTVGFIGSVSLFSICLFTFLLTCLSIVFFFINKNRQTLSDFISFSITTKKTKKKKKEEID